MIWGVRSNFADNAQYECLFTACVWGGGYVISVDTPMEKTL